MADPDFPDFNQLTDARYGRMLYNENDQYIGKSMELYGEFSSFESLIFESILQPGMVAIEVGANIGAHTVPIARRVGPRGRVHAFEPQRLVFQTLCANIALNQLTNVHTHYAAAGDQPGSLTVPELDPQANNNFGGLALGGFEQGTEVPVVTIDSLELPACHFIKADVEGMEEVALRGGEETIKKHLPTLYVENDRKEKSVSLCRYLVSLGYRMYAHHPPLYNPDNHKQNEENVFDRIVSINLLCVPAAKNITVNGLPEMKMADEGADE